MINISKQFIKATMKTDLETYHAFACCYHLTKENLNEMGFSNRRIEGHLHDKLLKETNTWNSKYNKFDKIYIPTKAGSKFMASKIDMRPSDFYHSLSAFHDSGLYKIYSECEYKDTWLTENQLRDIREEEEIRLRECGEFELARELHEMTPTDGAYMRNGEMNCVEICTENYSDADKQSHTDFSTAIGASIEMYELI
ncbi:hypothetical protein [Clostridium sp.]